MKDKSYYAQKFKMPEKDIIHEFIPMISLLDDLVVSNETISKKFKESQKNITFKDKSEAFKFGLGVSLIPSLVVLIISILIFWGWSTKNDFEYMSNFISRYPNAKEYSLFIQNTELKSDKKGKYVQLKISKGKNGTVGQNYTFDKECECIKVPIYYY